MGQVRRFPADAALAAIDESVTSNARILGIDGFRIVPGGFEASFDLILDVSYSHISNAGAAVAAREFIRRKAGEDVLFEVWTDLNG